MEQKEKKMEEEIGDVLLDINIKKKQSSNP